jgi:hypothetical protein
MPPENDQNKKNEMPQKVKALRTYEDDIQTEIKRGQVSMSKIAISERMRSGKGASIGTTEPAPTNKKRLVVIGIVILLLGAGTYIFLSLNKTQEIVENTQQSSKPAPVIAIDSEKEIVMPIVKRSSIVDAIQKEVSAALPISTVEAIHLKDGLIYIGAKKFLRTLEVDQPVKLSQSILNEYTVGIHTFDGNHPFIVFKTNSYENAFTGMLAWEDNLVATFVPLVSGRSLLPTEKKTFEDGLVRNKDVRALKGEDGKLLLVYTFLDRETILITNSEYTVEEIGKRLNAFKTKR